MSNEEIKQQYSINQLKGLEKDWQNALEFTVKNDNHKQLFI